MAGDANSALARDHRKVAKIKSQDQAAVALGAGHHRGVREAQGQVGVALDQLRDAAQVVLPTVQAEGSEFKVLKKGIQPGSLARPNTGQEGNGQEGNGQVPLLCAYNASERKSATPLEEERRRGRMRPMTTTWATLLDIEPARRYYGKVVEGPSDQDAEAGKTYPGERQTRLSGAWTALIVGIVALVVILIFILQNLQSAEVYFLVFHGHLPLAVALLFAMVLGALVVLAFGGGRILQLRLVARRARRQAAQARPPTA